ncbi:ion transporter [Pseudohongiella sp.]|uniref:Ion transport domain-containing protein n=1 Tax=marine sediment metagenome TaxID=412755 RepID=A0A0F9W3R8_9ZZZZ|nr:ion transporter [Pseudohongiella sp.]HDZ10071.1 ion transporter [Pseudohongiella sp.]HEA63420.1 ion transporter [Pseudohongiella sp.]
MAGSEVRSTLRQRLYRQLYAGAWEGDGMSPVNRLVCFLVLIAASVAVLDTEVTLRDRFADIFFAIELILFVFFLVEYIARVYASGEDPQYRGFVGRLKYIVSFWALVDLLALIPFLVTLGVSDAFVLRLMRLLRLLRLARLGRFSDAIDAVLSAVGERRYELMLSLLAAMFLLVGSSSVLYLVEADAQPETFGSIPRALWWSVATLTTVGYGDVTPITALGKICAGVTAIAGIGLIAMPTGVLAAAFSDALQRKRAGAKPIRDLTIDETRDQEEKDYD